MCSRGIDKNCEALFEISRTFAYVRNRKYRRARGLVHDKVGPALHCELTRITFIFFRTRIIRFAAVCDL